MRRALLLTIVLALVATPPALAQPPGGDAMAYNPPAGDLKPRRVAGNVRGAVAAAPAVTVLTPDHLALTISERPTLLWYLSAPTTARIEVVLVDPRRSAPLLETAASGERAGIHAVRLGDAGVRLEPGVAYEWSVAVVVDPAQRSRDVVTTGAVMRVAPSPAVSAALTGATPERRAAALAAAGIWYDALATLTEALAARPDDADLRGRRLAILEQAGLAEAAAFERRP